MNNAEQRDAAPVGHACLALTSAFRADIFATNCSALAGNPLVTGGTSACHGGGRGSKNGRDVNSGANPDHNHWPYSGVLLPMKAC